MRPIRRHAVLGRTARRPTGLLLFAAVGLTLTLGLPEMGSLGGATSRGPLAAPTGFAAGSPCYGASLPAQYAGVLSVARGVGPTPGVANVNVSLVYHYTLNYTSNSGRTTFSCNTAVQMGATNGSGGVALTTPIPTNSCSAGSCSRYTGPFGPVSAYIPAGLPPGYFLSVNFAGGKVQLTYVQALASVALSLLPRTTLSVNAPTSVRATAMAGDGSASPAAVAYDWRLSGTGWTLTASPSNSVAVVEASQNAGPGLLALWTNGTFNASSTDLPETMVELTPVATSLTSGSVTPTAVDAGTPAGFSLVGSGAVGYNYTAWVRPGLNLSPIALPCATAPAPGGQVTVTCSGRAAYPASGVAQPTGNLTNGYSTASWSFAQVDVAPALALAASPDPAFAYAGANLTLRVSVAQGTGTAPFGPACFSPRVGANGCSFSPGPAWTFSTAYSAPGAYLAWLSVGDSAGTNRSLPIPVRVWDRPFLPNVTASSNVVSVGRSVAFNDSITGGALPLAYWWNDSAPAGTLYAGNLGADGPLSLRYVAETPGLHRVTLTVVDSLGSAVASAVTFAVVRGNATGLVTPAVSAQLAATAGTPTMLSWVAVDSTRGPVPVYDSNVTLTVNQSAGAGPGLFWVNFTGGSLAGNATNGVVPLSESTWSNGYLNVTLTFTRAGPVSVNLAASLPVEGAPPGGLHVLVAPDPNHLKLVHPKVVEPGRRANATQWQIVDRFGNPSSTEYIVIHSVFGPAVYNEDSPVKLTGGVAWVWVNYSAPADGAGTVYVLTKFGEALLAPLSVPALAAGITWTVIGAGLAAGVAVGIGVGYVRRRRRRTAAAQARGVVADDELERLAEGRAHVLARAAQRPRTTEELIADFNGPPPDRAEAAEWIGSLVAEGSLRAQADPSGSVRFAAVPDRGEAPPRVVLDRALLDSVLARQAGPPENEEETAPGEGSAAR
jgi:hypothetical protein